MLVNRRDLMPLAAGGVATLAMGRARAAPGNQAVRITLPGREAPAPCGVR
jgi:hypothetical protein